VFRHYRSKIPAFLPRWWAGAGMTVLLLFSFWLMVHTFSYDGNAHTILIARKLWSDFGAHIPLIRSFSLGNNFPNPIKGSFVQYPIFPGVIIRYHFLFFLFVGLLERTGVRIDWALNIPSALGFFFLLILLYILAKKLFQSTAVAVLSVVFFLFNGSLGFFRFFAMHPLSSHTIGDILHIKDFPAFAPWSPGDVTAFWNLNIYTNQRHLALAFALALLFIFRIVQNKKYSWDKQMLRALPWGVVFGILPFFHQPTLLILAVFMACYLLLYPNQWAFIVTTGIITTLLAVPQMALTGGGVRTAEWYPGYIIHNDLLARQQVVYIVTRMLSFWWQNLGLHGILIIIGFFFIPRRAKKAIFPIIPLFVIANCFKFSVEASANHKFFNFAMALGQMISAYILVSLFNVVGRRFNHWIIRVLDYVIIGILILFLTFSGIIDFFVIFNDAKGPVADIPANEVATWIVKNTPPDAVFLNSSYLYHPASLAGRPIFLGWPYFPWSAGYKENRMPIMNIMYETRDETIRCKLFKQYNISYITVEDVKNDPNLPRIDYAYFRNHFTPVFVSSRRNYAIYTAQELCK
jgi:hypothetical protein